MAEVLAKAEKYINGEEALISKKESSSTHKERSRTDKQQGRSPKRQRNRERSPKKDRERSPKRQGTVPKETRRRQRSLGTTSARATSTVFTSAVHPPLTATVSQVLREVQHEQFPRWPTQMRSYPTKTDNTRYCEFHRDHGHRMDDCIQLRKEIEYLIRCGYLRRFISFEGQN